MQSPIALMQRMSYPRHPSPLGYFPTRGHPSRALFHPVGGFGDLTQGITGVKAGVQAGTLSTSIGTGAATLLGAAGAGSVVPIVGTAIGVIVALVASGVFSHRMDPEVGNFNNAMALVRAQGPQAVLGIQDKYLVLAGLFDLEPGQIKGNIPIYKKYGRMGEQRFVMDMCALIQSAANQGIITANDTVQSVYDKVVAPWINGFGFGPMQDSNTELITTLLLGLIGEYVSGQYKQRWYAVGGQFAFGSLPAFALPQASAVAPTTSGTPTPSTPPPAAAVPQPVSAAPQVPSVAPVPVGYDISGPAPFAVFHRSDGVLVWDTTGAGNWVPYPPGRQMVPADASGAPTQSVPGFVYTGSGQFYPTAGMSNLPAVSGPLSPYASGGALTTNTQAGTSPFASTAPSYIPYAPPSAPLPTVGTTPITAGIGSGLPSWLSWGAVAGVVGLMLITARPVGGKFKVSRRRR